MTEDLPKHLYHYTPFNEGRIRSIFQDHKIFCSDPLGFNDLWDCRPQFYIPDDTDAATRNRYVDWMLETAKQRSPKMPDVALDALRRSIEQDPGVFAEEVQFHADQYDASKIEQALYAKSEVWKYESEYRLIASERSSGTSSSGKLICDNGFLEFPTQALTSITAGILMPRGKIVQLQKIVSNYGPIPVYEASKGKNTYEVHIERLQ